MFGRGVIASLYGWALEKAGHSVEFYVRPGRIAEHGSALDLRFSDARKKLQGVPVEETWQMRLREDLPVDHDYELIVLSVQHYRFAEAAAFLGPRVSKATVLVFNNFWTEPREATADLPADQLAWGFPMAGGGFDANGVLKGALFSRVQLGTFGTNPTAREAAVRRLFREAGFGIGEQRDFRGWLWIHFAVNAGLLSQVQPFQGVHRTSIPARTRAVATCRRATRPATNPLGFFGLGARRCVLSRVGSTLAARRRSSRASCAGDMPS